MIENVIRRPVTQHIVQCEQILLELKLKFESAQQCLEQEQRCRRVGTVSVLQVAPSMWPFPLRCGSRAWWWLLSTRIVIIPNRSIRICWRNPRYVFSLPHRKVPHQWLLIKCLLWPANGRRLTLLSGRPTRLRQFFTPRSRSPANAYELYMRSMSVCNFTCTHATLEIHVNTHLYIYIYTYKYTVFM